MMVMIMMANKNDTATIYMDKIAVFLHCEIHKMTEQALSERSFASFPSLASHTFTLLPTNR